MSCDAVAAFPVQEADAPVVEEEVSALPVQEAEAPVQEPEEPEQLPVKAPTKPVAESIPVEGTKESAVVVLIASEPEVLVAQPRYTALAVEESWVIDTV